jgi:prepilin-type N-terminal cleavage/methylation domain-containing protein
MNPRHQSGMSLLELMIVVVIVAILAAVALPVYSGYKRRSRAVEGSANVQLIAQAQEAYKREKGHYANVNLDNPSSPACSDGGCPSQWDNWSCAAASNWCQLGFRPERQSVYFVYNTWGGSAGPATPAWAAALVQNPQLGWYSIEGRADLRNDNGAITRYRMTSTGTNLIPVDEFE